MTKPDDIDQDAWEKAQAIAKEATRKAMEDALMPYYITVSPFIARAIMSARAEERSIFTDAGCDHGALTSAVGVLRIQQAQPHRSTQHVLWEAIKDYAARAAIRNRP